jgi:hypothetical protein
VARAGWGYAQSGTAGGDVNQSTDTRIPTTLLEPGSLRFWSAALITGIGAGVCAILLTRLLEIVQHLAWAGSGTHILEAAMHADSWRRILVLLSVGILVVVGHLVLSRLSSGNGIDITTAIWFSAGRMPAV